MGGGSDSAKQRESQNAAANFAWAQALQGRQTDQYNRINPFASALLNAGQQALSGKAPDFFANAMLPNLESGFQGARQNLVSFFGKSGQGISGLAAGPFANEQNEEANSMSNAQLQAIMQGLNLGGQGANMALGQQSIFNPSPYFQNTSTADNNIFAMSQNPWMGLVGGILGAGLSSALGPGGAITKNTGCWVAEEIYGKDDLRVWIIRLHLLSWSLRTPVGHTVRAVYLRHGERAARFIKKHASLKRLIKPVFDWLLWRALRETPSSTNALSEVA